MSTKRTIKVIQLPPGGGKTAKAIELADKEGLTVVCHSDSECKSILHRALKLGKHIPTPISYDKFMHRKFVGSDIKGFIVDNVDAMLHYLSTGVPVHAVTLDNGKDMAREEWVVKDSHKITGGEEPSTYTCGYGGVEIYITNAHIDYKPEWIMHCYALGINTKPLIGCVTADDAKKAAIKAVVDKAHSMFTIASEIQRKFGSVRVSGRRKVIK